MNHSIDTDYIMNTLLSIANHVSEGKAPLYEHNECYSTGAFNSVIQGVKDPSVSYTILQILINNYKSLKYLQRTAYFELLYCLMISSNTTEVPEGLEEIINDNSDNDIISTIKKWYRM